MRLVSRLRKQPWHGVFPTAVRQLGLLGPIGLHDEKTSVGLGIIVIEHRLVFEPVSRTAPHHVFPIIGPNRVGVVAGRFRELLKIRTIGPDGVDVPFAFGFAREKDAIAEG